MRWFSLLLLLASPAHALYVNSKVDWDAMNYDRKVGFVAGFFDGATRKKFDAISLEEDRSKVDIELCVADLGLTSTQLIEVVEKGYEDLSQWDRPPGWVLMDGLQEVCLESINARRAARGVTPLKP